MKLLNKIARCIDDIEGTDNKSTFLHFDMERKLLTIEGAHNFFILFD